MPLKKDPKASKEVTFAHVNNVTTSELLYEFQPHLEAMDINPELPRDKQERMRQVIQDNLFAFAFGSEAWTDRHGYNDLRDW
jgi:phosphoglucomutase